MQHYPADSSRALGALLVLAHGAGAGERHPFMTKVSQGLAERGIDVVTFEFPYLQQKRSVPDKAPVLEAAFRDAIRDARRLVTADHRVFAGGKSMGGRIATHLAAQQIGDLRGVVALGYPLHPPGKPEQLRVAHLPSIRIPILIVQGERDAFGTPDELKPHVDTMRAPATLHVVVGGDHSLSVRGAAQKEAFATVLDTVARWCQEVILAPAS